MTHYSNSESIFSVIGDYPVVDQYDVLYSNLAAGSTYDNYITGSLLRYSTNFFTGKVSIVRGERGLVFSRLNVARDSIFTGSGNDPNRSYNLQPRHERAGIIRNMKVFSNNERFYDTLPPRLVDMVNSLSGSGGRIESNGPTAIIPIQAFNVHYPPSPPGSFGPDFVMSFPFEPKFSTAKRLKKLATGYVATAGTAAGKSFNNIVILYGFAGNYVIAYENGAFPIGPKDQDAAKVLYGFGDTSTVGLYAGARYGYSNAVSFRSGSVSPSSHTVNCLISPIIRGWKYGIYDGNPHYTSCIFRRDKFGQYRDMLEQRLNAPFILDEENSPTNYFGSFETPATPPALANNTKLSNTITKNNNEVLKSFKGTFDSPLKVGFVKQTIYPSNNQLESDKLVYEVVQPVNTWSSNLSTYATSSLPYFDDVSRNRPPITEPPNSIVITTLANSFGRSTII